MQVPSVLIVTYVETPQTEGVSEVRVTGRPELLVGETAKLPEIIGLSPMTANVIDCADFGGAAMLKDCATCGAALKLALPA